jgi:hypothetical protein
MNQPVRIRYRSLSREELESIIPKQTLKQSISIELSKFEPLEVPEKIKLEEAKEFEEKAEKYIINHSTAEIREFRSLLFFSILFFYSIHLSIQNHVMCFFHF